jgi:hypothetical protein
MICQNLRRPGVGGLRSRSPYLIPSKYPSISSGAMRPPPSTLYAVPTEEKRIARKGGEGALR